MVFTKCAYCGMPLERSSSRASKAKNFFCNPRCKGNWQIGRFTAESPANQYRVVKLGDGSRGNYKEHRLVASFISGRNLHPDEHVHHINGIKTDNRPENLAILGASEHSSLHHRIGLDLEQIKAKREAGLIMSEIGNEMGAGRHAIARRLKELDLPTRRQLSWDLDSAINLLRAGKSRAEVARTIGIAETTLRKVLRNRGIECSDSRFKNSYDLPAIQELIERGVSIESIAKKIGVSYGALWKFMRRQASVLSHP